MGIFEKMFGSGGKQEDEAVADAKPEGAETVDEQEVQHLLSMMRAKVDIHRLDFRSHAAMEEARRRFAEENKGS